MNRYTNQQLGDPLGELLGAQLVVSCGGAGFLLELAAQRIDQQRDLRGGLFVLEQVDGEILLKSHASSFPCCAAPNFVSLKTTSSLSKLTQTWREKPANSSDMVRFSGKLFRHDNKTRLLLCVGAGLTFKVRRLMANVL